MPKDEAAVEELDCTAAMGINPGDEPHSFIYVVNAATMMVGDKPTY